MAIYGRNQSIPGLTAVSSLASAQWYIVQLASTAGQVKLATSGTSKIIGVVVNDPTAGQAAEVVHMGLPGKVAAETGVSVGSWLTSSSTGRAKATTTEGDYCIGQAMDASSSAGDLIRYIGVVQRIGT